MTLPPAADPRALAELVARAARRPRSARAMLVDLDGTLAPLAARPEEAVVPIEALEGLRGLCRAGWCVAVVSGRAEASARRLVPLDGVAVFGSHGLEGPWPEPLRPRVDAEVARRIERLARAAEGLARREPGAWVERKPAGFAVHGRAVVPSRRAAFRRAVLDAVSQHRHPGIEVLAGKGIEVLAGKGIVELRAAGVHKGRVLEALGFRGPRRPDPSLVAIGDDRTDEDLFRTLGRRGLAIRVGPSRAATSARLRLASPRGVARFLRYLAEASQRGAA